MASEIVFRGSVCDGVDVDLVEWCGLPKLSDEQHDRLWGATNETDLIELCDSAFIQITGEFDGGPGQSDDLYQVETQEVDKFKEELRKVITGYIDPRP
jgi:hypothetical protein